MADKFIDLVAGEQVQKTPLTTSAGAGSSGSMIALDPSGKLDSSFMPSGVASRINALATEDLGEDKLINLWVDGGVTKARLADATDNTKPADGYVDSPVTNGNSASVIPLSGLADNLSGLTPGKIFLATTPGGVTSTPPSVSGNIVQEVGVAVTATSAFYILDRQKAVTV